MHYGGQHRVYGNEEQACVCECKKGWTKEGMYSEREQEWNVLAFKASMSVQERSKRVRKCVSGR